MATHDLVTKATEEDLWAVSGDDLRHELVDGRITTMSPAGFRHDAVIGRLIALLGQYVFPRKLGAILGSSGGFRLPDGNVRSPDAAFVAASRFSGSGPKGFFDGAPDLAAEVLSPGDSPREVLDKVGEWLQAGTRLVWVIDPERRAAVVYRSLSDVDQLAEFNRLLGGDVVPGFECLLEDVLGEE